MGLHEDLGKGQTHKGVDYLNEVRKDNREVGKVLELTLISLRDDLRVLDL